MKRKYLYYSLMLIVCACTQSGHIIEDEVTAVSFNADRFVAGIFDIPETRIAFEGNSILWTVSDTLGIFPETGSQLYFNTTNPGATSTSFDGGGWSFKNSSLYFSYFPFIGNFYLDRYHIPVSYVSQIQNGIDDNDIGECCFMYTDATSADSGNLHFQYHQLGCILRVRATLPEGTYTRLAVTAPSDCFVMEGWYNLLDQSPVIIPATMGNQLLICLNNITLTSQTQITVYLMTAPVNLKGTEVTVSVLNSEKTEYQQKKTPSGEYLVGTLNGLTCNDLQAVPQSMGLILVDWEDGGSISGDGE